MFADSDLHKLDFFLNTVEFSDGITGLQKAMKNNMEKATTLRGITSFHKVSAITALDMYHDKAKATFLDKNISIV